MILIDWLYPPKCMFCQNILKSGVFYVCDKCEQEIEIIKGHVCYVCGKPKKQYIKACNRCKDMFFSRNHALFLYQDNVRDAVTRFKYAPKPQYAKYFGAMMAEHFAEYIKKGDALVGIPLHKTRYKERGFNQADLLAEEISKVTNVPCLPPNSMIRVKKTKQQSSLDRNSRKNNITDAFAITNTDQIINKNIIIVDDIYTTGATMNECARILKLAGANEVSTLSLSIAK